MKKFAAEIKSKQLDFGTSPKKFKQNVMLLASQFLNQPSSV